MTLFVESIKFSFGTLGGYCRTKAGSTKTSSRPIKSGKQNPPSQAVQLQAAKRMESLANLELEGFKGAGQNLVRTFVEGG